LKWCVLFHKGAAHRCQYSGDDKAGTRMPFYKKVNGIGTDKLQGCAAGYR
jgi:hypothetical protein